MFPIQMHCLMYKPVSRKLIVYLVYFKEKILPILLTPFQAAPMLLSRTLAEDLPIKVERPSSRTVVFPKGSRVIVDLINTCKSLDLFYAQLLFNAIFY